MLCQKRWKLKVNFLLQPAQSLANQGKKRRQQMRNREFLSQTDVVNFFAKSGLLTTYNIARKADATSTKRAAHTGSSSQDNQAERAGFEPARAFTLRALQARALDQAMRPLHGDDYSIPAGFEQIIVAPGGD